MLFQGPCQGRRQTVKYRLPALGAEGIVTRIAHRIDSGSYPLSHVQGTRD